LRFAPRLSFTFIKAISLPTELQNEAGKNVRQGKNEGKKERSIAKNTAKHKSKRQSFVTCFSNIRRIFVKKLYKNRKEVFTNKKIFLFSNVSQYREHFFLSG
jgi:hypothetical protein